MDVLKTIPYALNSKTNNCFTFFLRAQECISNNVYTHLTCYDKFEDFQECRTKTKSAAYRAWYAKELRKIEILSIPKYDDVTDSFVDDKNFSVEGFFNKDDKLSNFFKINLNSNHHDDHSEGKHSHSHTNSHSH